MPNVLEEINLDFCSFEKSNFILFYFIIFFFSNSKEPIQNVKEFTAFSLSGTRLSLFSSGEHEKIHQKTTRGLFTLRQPLRVGPGKKIRTGKCFSSPENGTGQRVSNKFSPR